MDRDRARRVAPAASLAAIVPRPPPRAARVERVSQQPAALHRGDVRAAHPHQQLLPRARTPLVSLPPRAFLARLFLRSASLSPPPRALVFVADARSLAVVFTRRGVRGAARRGRSLLLTASSTRNAAHLLNKPQA